MFRKLKQSLILLYTEKGHRIHVRLTNHGNQVCLRYRDSRQCKGTRYIQLRVWDYERAGFFVLLKCAQNSSNSSIK